MTSAVTNAAMQMLRCVMNDIVEQAVRSYGRDVNWDVREKVSHYISLLAASGQTEAELLAFGTAYLKEILEPDPRYSGC